MKINNIRAFNCKFVETEDYYSILLYLSLRRLYIDINHNHYRSLKAAEMKGVEQFYYIVYYFLIMT